MKLTNTHVSKNRSIKVFAPGTVVNVGCGFDVLGFAIHGPGDKIIMRLNETKKVSVVSITGNNGLLSRKANENTASVAVLKNKIETRVLNDTKRNRASPTNRKSPVCSLQFFYGCSANKYNCELISK